MIKNSKHMFLNIVAQICTIHFFQICVATFFQKLSTFFNMHKHFFKLKYFSKNMRNLEFLDRKNRKQEREKEETKSNE